MEISWKFARIWPVRIVRGWGAHYGRTSQLIQNGLGGVMIRVLVADDQQLFRTGLIRVFSDVPNVSIVGEAATGEDAVASARHLKPDIVLMEILLSGMGGLEATQRIVRFEPAPRVIALTHCVNAPYPAQMLKAGARGYLSKNVDQAELLLAIRRVFGGQRYVCHDVAQELASYAYEMHTAVRLIPCRIEKCKS